MNVIQRFAARLLPAEWFRPSDMDRYWGPQLGAPITSSDVNRRLAQAQVGDTRLLSGLKAEMRSVDGDLESHLGKIEGMLSAAPLELVAPKDPIAEEIAGYCREQLTDPDLDLPAVIKHALWGLLDGVAPFQVSMRPVGKGFRLAAITPVPSERVFWPAGSTELHIQPDGDTLNVVPVSSLGYSCAVLVVDPHVLARDRVGLLRRCLAPWLTKLYGFDWWRRAVELHGTPYRKAKYRGGTNLTQLEASLKAMGTAGYGMFPDGVDLEFVTQALGSRNAHEDLVGYCDREKAKVLLGGTQTADIQQGSGSKASAGVHERGLEVKVDGYGRQIGAFLRAQVLKPLVTLQYGAAAAERFTPVPVLRVKSNADLGTFFAAIKLAMEAGMETIPVTWVHEQAGIPMPEEDEECLELPETGPETPEAGAGASGEPAEPPDPEDGAEVDPELEKASARRPAPAAGIEGAEAFALRYANGAGRELLAPLDDLIQEAIRDGATLPQLLARVIQRSGLPPSSPKLIETLTAVQLDAAARGWTEARG